MRRVRLKREKIEMFNQLKMILNKELELQMAMTTKQEIRTMQSSTNNKSNNMRQTNTIYNKKATLASQSY